MIERKTIEELIQLMEDHDLVELDVVDGDQSVTLRRAGAVAQHMPMPMMPAAAPAPAPAAAPEPSSSGGGGGAAPAAPDGMTIDSPMVGTFYSKANPDADPFVSVGSKVSESSVVCLVEAMKVFNEIKAEMRGTIAEILVSDGEAVEYGQPLFRVKPD